ncbi:low affinity immunoglobulin gamma Fc region receptor III-B-like [Dugong dugon]
MWQLLPPTALLLVVSAGQQTVNPPKAVVSLDPPWYRLLEKDKVILKCLPEGNSTQWWHNGSLISSQSSSYFIESARVNDSGAYQCQTSSTMPSDPVQLEVHIGWVLLQAVRQVFLKGETIELRCHAWKSKPLHKVSYFQDGRSKRFTHDNAIFHIPKATGQHNGSYFCRGLIGSRNESSRSLNIYIQDLEAPSITPGDLHWLQVTLCLMTGLLFAVDTGLYFLMQRKLRSLMEGWKINKLKWSQSFQLQTTPHAIG